MTVEVKADSAREDARLRSLYALRILNTPKEERFDRITRLALKVFGVEVSSIGFLDSNRLWFKSIQGLSLREAPRATSFCSTTVLSAQPLIVGDASRDARFATMPTVNTDPHLRFYAGIPLFSHDEQAVGSLCIVDYTPRSFSPRDVEVLKELASWAQAELRQSRSRQLPGEVIFSRDRLSHHPRVDPVTRFWNRATMEIYLRQQLDLARIDRTSVGVILLRIDQGERIAQEGGGERRDAVMTEVGRLVRGLLRPADLLGRYGQHEVLAILPGVDLAKAAIAGERLRERVECHRPEGSLLPPVTVTVAAAASGETDDLEVPRLLQLVERTLSKAVASGGNRTRLASRE